MIYYFSYPPPSRGEDKGGGGVEIRFIEPVTKQHVQAQFTKLQKKFPKKEGLLKFMWYSMFTGT